MPVVEAAQVEIAAVGTFGARTRCTAFVSSLLQLMKTGAVCLRAAELARMLSLAHSMYEKLGVTRELF